MPSVSKQRITTITLEEEELENLLLFLEQTIYAIETSEIDLPKPFTLIPIKKLEEVLKNA